MFGLILWSGERTVQRQKVLGVPFACVGLSREGKRLSDRTLRRRLLVVGRRLRQLGVEEVVLPEAFAAVEELEKSGLRAVSTCPLARLLAADWLAEVLARTGIAGSCVEIGVAADRLTGEVARTVTELSLRYRYPVLDLPAGGEALAARLRREYGVALKLDRQTDRLTAAVLFSPRPDWESRVPLCLPLYKEGVLPELQLPEKWEEALVPKADRGMLLAALLRAGVLEPQQLQIAHPREELHSEFSQELSKSLRIVQEGVP